MGVSSASSNQTQGQFTQAVSSNPLGFACNQRNPSTGFTSGTTNGSQSGIHSNSNQASGFTFGNQANTKQQTGFTFGTTGANNTQQSGFMFGNPSANINPPQSGGFTFGSQSTSNNLVHLKSGFKAGNVTGYTAALLTNVQGSGGGFGPVSNNNVGGYSFFVPSRTNYPSNQNVIVTDFMQPNKKYMFVARVLVGRCCFGSSKIRKPPPDPGDSKKRPFNSCVDNEISPSVFVIFDISQCYPEYIIEYKR